MKDLTEEEEKTLEEVAGRFTEVFRWFFKQHPIWPIWVTHGRTKTVEQEEE